MRVTVSRKAHFNAAHRLYVKSWDEKKNESVFGKCSNEYYHGHNYELFVNITGKMARNLQLTQKKINFLTKYTLNLELVRKFSIAI